MKAQRNIHLLFNWPFVCGLVLLALNDHVFKWQFSNWFTGKLSDFVGLLILPMFILFLFPKLKLHAFTISALFFIFWKLPISESFINSYNQFSLIPIVRIVDYTDLLALLILPFSYFFIKHISRYRIFNGPKISLNPLFVLVPSCFVFMATSPPISYYMKPSGDIHIGKAYKIKSSKEVILKRLKEEGFLVRLDTSKSNINRQEYYLIENVILNNGRDTIKSVQFGFRGKYLLINNVNVNGEFKISDWKELKRYSQHYNKLIKDEIVVDLK